MPGVVTQEIDPWNEDGEVWRRLQVNFPGPAEARGNGEPALWFRLAVGELLKQASFDRAWLVSG
jgi:hypothetical protein